LILWSGKVLKVLNQIVKWVRQESAAFQALAGFYRARHRLPVVDLE